MSSKQTLSSSLSEKYLSRIPALFGVPMISSFVSRCNRINPLSPMIRSNCSQHSKNRPAASLSCISLGMMNPRVRALNALVARLCSRVVFVRNR